MGKKASDEDKFRDILANLKQNLEPVDNGIYTEVSYQSFMNGLQEIVRKQIDRISNGLPPIEVPGNKIKSLTAEQKLDQLENVVKPIYERYSVDYLEAISVDQVAMSKDKYLALETAIMGLFRMLTYGENLPLDAPPVALDAAICLRSIAQSRAALTSNNAEHAAEAALKAGEYGERVRVRAFEEAAKDGKRLAATRKKGGENSGSLKKEEWQLVIAERKRLVKENQSYNAKYAATLIHTMLIEGTFPGIDRKIERVPGVSTIARKMMQMLSD